MKVIRYGLHFAILTVAAVIFWLAKDLHLPYWISNFDFFHYALMGALHAACIVVSLRDHRATHPIISFSDLCVVFHHASYHIERCDIYFGVVGVNRVGALRRHFA
jgi:hypothetical protein